MTGPEHYREAERLMAGTDELADPETGIGPMHYDPSVMELRAAQVHATLALAAATALKDRQAWVEVAGVPFDPPARPVTKW